MHPPTLTPFIHIKPKQSNTHLHSLKLKKIRSPTQPTQNQQKRSLSSALTLTQSYLLTSYSHSIKERPQLFTSIKRRSHSLKHTCNHPKMSHPPAITHAHEGALVTSHMNFIHFKDALSNAKNWTLNYQYCTKHWKTDCRKWKAERES